VFHSHLSEANTCECSIPGSYFPDENRGTICQCPANASVVDGVCVCDDRTEVINTSVDGAWTCACPLNSDRNEECNNNCTCHDKDNSSIVMDPNGVWKCACKVPGMMHASEGDHECECPGDSELDDAGE